MSNLNPLFTALCLAFEMRSNHLAGEMAMRKRRKKRREKERDRNEECSRERFPEEAK